MFCRPAKRARREEKIRPERELPRIHILGSMLMGLANAPKCGINTDTTNIMVVFQGRRMVHTEARDFGLNTGVDLSGKMVEPAESASPRGPSVGWDRIWALCVGDWLKISRYTNIYEQSVPNRKCHLVRVGVTENARSFFGCRGCHVPADRIQGSFPPRRFPVFEDTIRGRCFLFGPFPSSSISRCEADNKRAKRRMSKLGYRPGCSRKARFSEEAPMLCWQRSIACERAK